MSVMFPWTSANETGGVTGYRCTIPSAVAQKPANTSYTTLFFFRARDFEMPNPSSGTSSIPVIIASGGIMLARANGGGGGSDAFFSIDTNHTQVNCAVRNGGSLLFNQGVAVGRGKDWLIMLICNAANTHLVSCEVGGVPTVVTDPTGGAHTAGMTTTQAWLSIGGSQSGSVRPYFGSMENVCMWTGAFPETAGDPDRTLIANIANGTQSLDTLHTDVTPNLTRRFRFPLANEVDLTDAWSVNVLTEANKGRATGRVMHPFGPIRPATLMPARVRDQVSQVVFGTRGNSATATAQIKIEGGSYSGLASMSKVQARLLHEETRAVIRDWTDMVTTAPSAGAGTWAANETGWTGVPMTAAYFYVEFRAVDSGNAVIAGPVPGYALRRAGFHIVGQAQSQWAQGVTVGSGLALTSGIRFLVTNSDGNELIPAGIEPEQPASQFQVLSYIVSSGCDLSLGVKRMQRAMANEINAIYPGVPIQHSNISQGGTGLAEFYGTGSCRARWGNLKTAFGVVQPYLQFHLGHSSDASGTESKLASLISYSQANYGTPVKYLHAPVPRYRNAGTTSIFDATSNSREGARDYVAANPSTNIWLGSWSTVFTPLSAGTETAGADPHSDLSSDFGQSRTGALAGLGVLMGSGAVLDVPIGITAVNAVGSTAVIRFGPINA